MPDYPGFDKNPSSPDWMQVALGQQPQAFPFSPALSPTRLPGMPGTPGTPEAPEAAGGGGFGSFFPGGGSQFASLAAMLAKAFAPQQYNRHGKVPTWMESLATGVQPMAQGSMMANALAAGKTPGQGMDPMTMLYLQAALKAKEGGTK